jgi:predicted transcriptional regulator
MYSVGIAYLLWFLSGFGVLGFHRFYLGKTPTGLLWMFTRGLGTVGAIFDFFTLPGQVRDANIRAALFGRPQWRTHFHRSRGPGWRDVQDGAARIVREKETVERVILKLAKQNGGILSSSELALEANISLDEAKKNLDALVSKGVAELRVRSTGTLVYTIPELMDRDAPLEDF